MLHVIETTQAKALSCPRNVVIVHVWNVGFVGEQKKNSREFKKQ